MRISNVLPYSLTLQCKLNPFTEKQNVLIVCFWRHGFDRSNSTI